MTLTKKLRENTAKILLTTALTFMPLYGCGVESKSDLKIKKQEIAYDACAGNGEEASLNRNWQMQYPSEAKFFVENNAHELAKTMYFDGTYTADESNGTQANWSDYIKSQTGSNDDSANISYLEDGLRKLSRGEEFEGDKMEVMSVKFNDYNDYLNENPNSNDAIPIHDNLENTILIVARNMETNGINYLQINHVNEDERNLENNYSVRGINDYINFAECEGLNFFDYTPKK